jgi:DNA/RNA-binding domain of Phe-tRNA-synthetase-like protein
MVERISDGEREVTADTLKTGRMYVLEERGSGGEHLRHIPRREDALPRIPITEDALEALREFRNGMRKQFGGYRPDIVIVISALVIAATNRPEQAIQDVRNYVMQMFQATATGKTEDKEA